MPCEHIRMRVHQHPSYDRRRSVPPVQCIYANPESEFFFPYSPSIDDYGRRHHDEDEDGQELTEMAGRGDNDDDDTVSHAHTTLIVESHPARTPTMPTRLHTVLPCMHTHTRACTPTTHTCPPAHHPPSHARPHSCTSIHTRAFTPTTYACRPAHQPSPPPPASNDGDAHSSPSKDSQHPGPAYRRQPSKGLFLCFFFTTIA